MNATANPPTRRVFSSLPWTRQLRWRLGLLLLTCLLLLGIGMSWWVQRDRTLDRDGYVQWQNANLAHYIAQRRTDWFTQPEGAHGQRLMRGTAMYVEEINPALEVYLLDPQGNILDHTLEKAPQAPQVNLAPLRAFLNSHAPLPVYGDDPRLGPGHSNLFSACAIYTQDQLQGYLYVVLHGARSDALAMSVERADIWRSTGSMLTLALLSTGLIYVLVQRLVTRRLQTLAMQLVSFHAQHEATPPAMGAGDEISLLEHTTVAMQKRINLQFQRLESADKMRRELISNITHDLHTPLANIQGYVETLLLKGDVLSEKERKHFLYIMLRQSRSMGQRIKELFELSKLESGQMQAQMEPFDLGELLSDIVQSYQAQATQRGILLALDPSAQRSAWVRADIAMIERVFQNLIDNALRHTSAQGEVCIAITQDGDAVGVRVRDTGSGIAAADLPHIFERYWTKSNATTSTHASAAVSSGLGLAIVRKILELHGSIIRVQSQLCEGTEFAFLLPRVRDA